MLAGASGSYEYLSAGVIDGRGGEVVRPHFPYRLRTLIVAVAGLALASACVGSYDRLSRRGMRDASLIGPPGFLYISCEEVAASRGDLTRRRWLATFYSPLNWIDHQLFGSETPV